MIGGPGVGFGYLDPAQPAGDRFGHDRHGRTFRTGDLVRRLPGGELLFLGRRDDQLKVGGVRVELGEIESVAAAVPGVSAAVALAVDGPEGPVIDLVVESRDGSLDQRALRAALAERLMGPVAPRRLKVVTALPRTPGGKIDRSRLPGRDHPGPPGTPPEPPQSRSSSTPPPPPARLTPPVPANKETR